MLVTCSILQEFLHTQVVFLDWRIKDFNTRVGQSLYIMLFIVTDLKHGQSRRAVLQCPKAGAHGFLKLLLFVTSACAFVCVSPPPRLSITSGVIWTPYDWYTNFTAVIQQR